MTIEIMKDIKVLLFYLVADYSDLLLPNSYPEKIKYLLT